MDESHLLNVSHKNHDFSSDEEAGFLNKFGTYIINKHIEEGSPITPTPTPSSKDNLIKNNSNIKVIHGSPAIQSSNPSQSISSPPIIPRFNIDNDEIVIDNQPINNISNNNYSYPKNIVKEEDTSNFKTKSIPINSSQFNNIQYKIIRGTSNYANLKDALSLSKDQIKQINEVNHNEEQEEHHGDYDNDVQDNDYTYHGMDLKQRQQQRQMEKDQENGKESRVLFGNETLQFTSCIEHSSSDGDDEDEDEEEGVEVEDEEIELKLVEGSDIGSGLPTTATTGSIAVPNNNNISTTTTATISSNLSNLLPPMAPISGSMTANPPSMQPPKGGETHIITELKPFDLNSPVFCRIHTISSNTPKSMEQDINIDTIRLDDGGASDCSITPTSSPKIESPPSIEKSQKKKFSFFRRKSSSSKLKNNQPEMPVITNQNITYNDILSDEGKYSMKVISELLKKLFGGKKYSTLNIFMGMALLHSYYRQVIIRNWNCVNDKQLLEEGLRYQKFCTASYGRKLYYGIMESGPVNFIKGLAGTDSLNTKVVIKHLGIEKQDIIATKWFSSKYSPGHFIAIDHKTKSVVLAIRGTFNHFDVITDLVCSSSNYSGGGAHLGMLLCSHKKMQEVESILLRELYSYPGYRLIVTGHSLGAGVASFFTFLFYDAHPEIPIHCYAYGTPCILSYELATNDVVKKLITCFSMNNDIISRLSFCSLFYLKEVLDSILSQSKTKIQRGFQIVSAGNGLGDKLTKKISKILRVSPTIDLSYVEHKDSGETQMFPAGTMYRIVKISKGVYVAELVDSKSFDKVIVSATMFTDHMPQKYEFGLSSAIENFEKKELTKKPSPQDASSNVKGVPVGTVIDETQLNKESSLSASMPNDTITTCISTTTTADSQPMETTTTNTTSTTSNIHHEPLTGLLVPTSLTATYSSAAPDE